MLYLTEGALYDGAMRLDAETMTWTPAEVPAGGSKHFRKSKK